MKTLLPILIWIITFPAYSHAQDPSVYAATCLTGGSYCLDYIDVYSPDDYNATIHLQDGDMATVISPTEGMYSYVYDDDSGAAESSPNVIKPDFYQGSSYSGAGRWLLVGLTATDISTDNTESLNNKYACSLSAAVVAIEATTTDTTLNVDCAATVAGAATVTTAYANLVMMPIGSITLGDNATLTLGGDLGVLSGAGIVSGFDGGEAINVNGAYVAVQLQQVFDPTNLAVTFGSQIAEAFPEHFGSIDGTSDEVQINYATTALNKGDVVLNGQSYTVDASITGATNVNLRGREGITTVNIGTADIDAFFATTKTNITISGIKWNGTGANADTERLVYFDTCTDVHSRNNIYTNSIIGLQFQTSTKWDSVDDTFLDILRKNDFDQGYGILANLDNDGGKVLGITCDGVARHCVYFSSGSDNCMVDGAVAIDSKGAPFVANSTDGQGVMKNIKFSDFIVNGIQTAGGGSDDVYGVIATGFISGLQVSDGEIYDNDVGGGVFVQNSSVATNFIEDVSITNILVDTIDGGAAFRVQNGKKIIISDCQADNIDVGGGTWSGIQVQVSGTGTGSGVDEVLIDGNIIDTGKYSISIAGVSATYKATNIILGANRLSNATSAVYSMSDVSYLTYSTTWPRWNTNRILIDTVASQTETEVYGGIAHEVTGSGSVTSGTTSDVIGHGLSGTPILADISITGGENPTNDVGTVWVDTIGAANFTVNVEADPGASNWDFGWKAKALGTGNWTAIPFDGYLWKIYAMVNEDVAGSSTITFNLKDDSGVYDTFDFDFTNAGGYQEQVFALPSILFSAGDQIEIVYTTDGAWIDTAADFDVGAVFMDDQN